MRWITFFLLLYFFTAAHTAHLFGIPPTATPHLASPAPTAAGESAGQPWPYIEFLPLLAIFYALYASETAAPLAALFCGLAYDIFQSEYIGTSLIPLALVGWLIVRIRLSIFREHFISQVVMTLLGVFAFALLSVMYRSAIGAPLHGNSVLRHLGYHAANAFYTAIAAPLVFYLLFRFQGLLGFTSHGPRTRPHG